jgi:hypothetical protein
MRRLTWHESSSGALSGRVLWIDPEVCTRWDWAGGGDTDLAAARRVQLSPLAFLLTQPALLKEGQRLTLTYPPLPQRLCATYIRLLTTSSAPLRLWESTAIALLLLLLLPVASSTHPITPPSPILSSRLSAPIAHHHHHHHHRHHCKLALAISPSSLLIIPQSPLEALHGFGFMNSFHFHFAYIYHNHARRR